ncbi:MAG: hypothetical protein JRH20_12885 [Deltaproteobacteria bacterium]|nr:hypothetical protein [Deltaproteobacteria bacterium]
MLTTHTKPALVLLIALLWACSDSEQTNPSDASLSDSPTSEASEGSGAITFTWTLAGGSEDCANAHVSTVEVYVAGKKSFFPCHGATGQGGTLEGIPAGEYDFRLEGTGPNTTSAIARGKVTVVAGEVVSVDVDLQHEAYRGGSVLFQWTFAGGKSCAEAGVDEVQIAFADRTASFPCAGPQGQQTEMTELESGAHHFTITGTSATVLRAKAIGEVLVVEDETQSFPVDLQLINPDSTATATITWRFDDSSATETSGCAIHGSERVYVEVGDEVPMLLPCLDFLTPGARQATLTHLLAGEVTIRVSAGASQAEQQATLLAGEETSLDFYLRNYSSPTHGSERILWTFGGKPCAEAGVSQLRLKVGGLITPIDKTVLCGDGTYSAPLGSFGTYPYELSATGPGGVQYAASGNLIANGVLHVDLLPVSEPATNQGDLQVDFTFSHADCTAAGLDEVQLFLVDEHDNVVPESQITATCAELPITIKSLAAPATYLINAQARRGASTPYTVGLYTVAVSADGQASYVVNMP